MILDNTKLLLFYEYLFDDSLPVQIGLTSELSSLGCSQHKNN